MDKSQGRFKGRLQQAEDAAEFDSGRRGRISIAQIDVYLCVQDELSDVILGAIIQISIIGWRLCLVVDIKRGSSLGRFDFLFVF